MKTEAKYVDDGGYAFPNPADDRSGWHAESGMTLRDWFAGQAISGFMANTKRPTTFARDDADWVYTIADAMIKARKGEI